MKPYLLLLAITYCYCINATCLLSKLSIDERVKKSPTIIEGEVIDQRSCWNADKSSIYTVNTVSVIYRLKGSAPATIEVITQGGEIDGKLLVVNPNAELKTGLKGVFFLQSNTISLNHSSTAQKYEVYGAAQGFIEQDKIKGSYNGPFDEYTSQSVLYGLIKQATGIGYRIGSNNVPNNNIIGGTGISLFTPATISAGTQSVLTIYGFGFGNRTGQATVQFKDANSTSSSVFTSVPDSSYILSWTDTEIRVIVPGASIMRQGGAGSGLINVIDANGSSISSNSPLNITYNQFEYKKNKISYFDQNGSGGYTFTLNSDFNNGAAKNAFVRALEQWQCKTGVNATISNTTTASTCSNQMDNINVVSFATASCPLPAGALGVTYSSYSLCTSSIVPDGIDMIFNPNTSYNFTTDAPSGSQYDFESIILHELGHAFGEGHNAVSSELMFPSIGFGAAKRVLNTISDIPNVTEILERSIITTSCGYLKHKKLTSACSSQPVTNPMVADFLPNKTSGCAPLSIQFTDKSLGSPTLWKWDVDNNGTTDYTTQNPSHTFNTPGSYHVKLVVVNGANKDSVISTTQITVAPALNLNMETVQAVSCYSGNNGVLKAIPSGGNGTYTYSWNNSQSGQTVNNLSAGQYSVTVKDGYNCSASKTVTISQPEPLDVKVNTELINNDVYMATLVTTGGTAPYNFTLNNASQFSTNIINNLNAGNYALIVKDKNNCTKSTSFSISAPTPVIETERSFDILDVYPNPANDRITVNFSLSEPKSIQLELFNISGQALYQDSYNNIKEKQTSIDLSALSAGTYILKFGLPEGNTFRKILINR
ncbi:MAG: T9SS type A sorting domain-containing protein [Sphingobacteriales bacterium]|nr:T9SS type A sorting domain-containing protein [Sphingobacteriales bacterium]